MLLCICYLHEWHVGHWRNSHRESGRCVLRYYREPVVTCLIFPTRGEYCAFYLVLCVYVVYSQAYSRQVTERIECNIAIHPPPSMYLQARYGALRDQWAIQYRYRNCSTHSPEGNFTLKCTLKKSLIFCARCVAVLGVHWFVSVEATQRWQMLC